MRLIRRCNCQTTPTDELPDDVVSRAIDAAVQALPIWWQRGQAQKEYERSDVAPVVRAVLEASPLAELRAENEALLHDLKRVMKRENDLLNEVERLLAALAQSQPIVGER
jgi:hypothetical protein